MIVVLEAVVQHVRNSGIMYHCIIVGVCHVTLEFDGACLKK